MDIVKRVKQRVSDFFGWPDDETSSQGEGGRGHPREVAGPSRRSTRGTDDIVDDQPSIPSKRRRLTDVDSILDDHLSNNGCNEAASLTQITDEGSEISAMSTSVASTMPGTEQDVDEDELLSSYLNQDNELDGAGAGTHVANSDIIKYDEECLNRSRARLLLEQEDTFSSVGSNVEYYIEVDYDLEVIKSEPLETDADHGRDENCPGFINDLENNDNSDGAISENIAQVGAEMFVSHPGVENCNDSVRNRNDIVVPNRSPNDDPIIDDSSVNGVAIVSTTNGGETIVSHSNKNKEMAITPPDRMCNVRSLRIPASSTSTPIKERNVVSNVQRTEKTGGTHHDVTPAPLTSDNNDNDKPAFKTVLERFDSLLKSRDFISGYNRSKVKKAEGKDLFVYHTLRKVDEDLGETIEKDLKNDRQSELMLPRQIFIFAYVIDVLVPQRRPSDNFIVKVTDDTYSDNFMLLRVPEEKKNKPDSGPIVEKGDVIRLNRASAQIEYWQPMDNHVIMISTYSHYNSTVYKDESSISAYLFGAKSRLRTLPFTRSSLGSLQNANDHEIGRVTTLFEFFKAMHASNQIVTAQPGNLPVESFNFEAYSQGDEIIRALEIPHDQVRDIQTSTVATSPTNPSKSPKDNEVLQLELSRTPSDSPSSLNVSTLDSQPSSNSVTPTKFPSGCKNSDSALRRLIETQILDSPPDDKYTNNSRAVRELTFLEQGSGNDALDNEQISEDIGENEKSQDNSNPVEPIVPAAPLSSNSNVLEKDNPDSSSVAAHSHHTPKQSERRRRRRRSIRFHSP